MTENMASKVSFLIFLLSSLASASLGGGEHSQRPHGLASLAPMVFPPSAYDFFNPRPKGPASSPLPLAAQVQANEAHEDQREESRTPHYAGGIVGIVLALACAVVLAMGAYHIVTTRRNNASKANAVEPNV